MKKGRCRGSFYVANDKFSVTDSIFLLPKIGEVVLSKALCFAGRIHVATVSRTADRWFVAIDMDVSDMWFYRNRTADNINGIDFGIKSAATLSSGEIIEDPKPLKTALRRLKIQDRRLSCKLEAAKVTAGFASMSKLPNGTKLRVANNCRKRALTLVRLHACVANARAGFTHKSTTRHGRENQAVVIEDPHVTGMLANDRLARAISDVGLGMFCSQMEYKAKRYGTTLIFANRWHPSSRLCSAYSWKNELLTPNDRQRTYPECSARHDRDHNTAIILKHPATSTALPVASPDSNGGAAAKMVSAAAGKVTPVRYEYGKQDVSRQDKNRAYILDGSTPTNNPVRGLACVDTLEKSHSPGDSMKYSGSTVAGWRCGEVLPEDGAE